MAPFFLQNCVSEKSREKAYNANVENWLMLTGYISSRDSFGTTHNQPPSGFS